MSERLKQNGGIAGKVARRKEGGGREFSAEDAVEVRAASGANDDASLRGIASGADLYKSAVERIRKAALEETRFAEIEARRVKIADAKKRVHSCTRFLQVVQDGRDLGPWKARKGDEGIFRLGEVEGGNRKYRAWVGDWEGAKSSLLPPPMRTAPGRGGAPPWRVRARDATASARHASRLTGQGRGQKGTCRS